MKRKISGGVRVEDGKTAWENHMSILSTCKKLGVKYYEYILEIYKGKKPKQSLANLITVSA